jgi:hypothetical protein
MQVSGYNLATPASAVDQQYISLAEMEQATDF